jgi:uncharacterized OB-fold protein
VSGFQVTRDDASAPFFDAAAEGTLLIRRCPVCGTSYPPQTSRCADSDQLEWVPASGSAVLVSWAVDHAAPLDPVLASPGGGTSTYGFVELSEGPWLEVPIVGVASGDLNVGVAMRVEFVRPGEGEAVPAFTRA